MATAKMTAPHPPRVRMKKKPPPWRAGTIPSTRPSTSSRAWPSFAAVPDTGAARGRRRPRAPALLLAGIFCLALAPLAAVAESGRAYIALVMDDLGYRLKEGRDTVALPPAVTLSFLPHTPHAPVLAAAAVARGHEIMLHMPMEARSGKALGPGGLTAAMARAEFKTTFRQAIMSLPAVVG